DQVFVRERRLRVLVEHADVAVGRRRIEIVIQLLDVLAVIALPIREAVHALLEDRILPVPQRDREAERLLGIAEPADPVLAPAIGAAARVVVREVVPGLAIRAVVLAHRAPLAFADIGTPLPPGLPAGVCFGQALLFGIRHGSAHTSWSEVMPRQT